MHTDPNHSNLSERRSHVVDAREFAVRRRALDLLRQDPNRFFSVVRDCDQRESAGAKPIDALEQALDAIGSDWDKIEPFRAQEASDER